MMTFTTSQLLDPLHEEAVFRLWNSEYPEKLRLSSLNDLELYLIGLKNQQHYFSSDENGLITGWGFSFEREHETWFAIIVDSAYHKKGLGKTLLNTLKEKNHRLNGWVIDHNNDVKINGEPYRSPLAFYQKQGFNVSNAVRLETEKLSAVKIIWHLTP